MQAKYFKGYYQDPNMFVQIPLQSAVQREIARYFLQASNPGQGRDGGPDASRVSQALRAPKRAVRPVVKVLNNDVSSSTCQDSCLLSGRSYQPPSPSPSPSQPPPPACSGTTA